MPGSLGPVTPPTGSSQDCDRNPRAALRRPEPRRAASDPCRAVGGAHSEVHHGQRAIHQLVDDEPKILIDPVAERLVEAASPGMLARELASCADWASGALHFTRRQADAR